MAVTGEPTRGCGITRTGGGTDIVTDPYVYTVMAPTAERGKRPVNLVSYWDALRFANWLHNGQPNTGVQDATTTEDGAYDLTMGDGGNFADRPRKTGWKWAVSSENEWYKAAYYKGGGPGAGYWDYPMQSDIPTVPGRLLPDAGNSANWHDSAVGAYPTGAVDPTYYRTAGGSYALSPSACGTFDQGGNVWEWNETYNASWQHQRRGAGYASGYSSMEAVAGVTYSTGWTDSQFIGFRVAGKEHQRGTRILLY